MTWFQVSAGRNHRGRTMSFMCVCVFVCYTQNLSDKTPAAYTKKNIMRHCFLSIKRCKVTPSASPWNSDQSFFVCTLNCPILVRLPVFVGWFHEVNCRAFASRLDPLEIWRSSPSFYPSGNISWLTITFLTPQWSPQATDKDCQKTTLSCTDPSFGLLKIYVKPDPFLCAFHGKHFPCSLGEGVTNQSHPPSQCCYTHWA